MLILQVYNVLFINEVILFYNIIVYLFFFSRFKTRQGYFSLTNVLGGLFFTVMFSRISAVYLGFKWPDQP